MHNIDQPDVLSQAKGLLHNYQVANFPLPDSLEALLRGYEPEPSIEVVTIVNDNLSSVTDRLISRVNNADMTIIGEKPVPKVNLLTDISIADQPHGRFGGGNYNVNGGHQSR